MPKFSKIELFSTHFGVPAGALQEAELLDPVLTIDTKLFIDPLLLRKSANLFFSDTVWNEFQQYFGDIFLLLSKSTSEDSITWKEARRRLRGKEEPGVCLGYGVTSTSGSSLGVRVADKLLRTAKEITDLGIKEPEILGLLPLIEDGIGPDTISDITVSAVQDSMMRFTHEFLEKHKPNAGRLRQFTSRKGNEYTLPVHPFLSGNQQVPILLVPIDILRALPQATTWDEVCQAARQNEQYRLLVSNVISQVWADKSMKEKQKMRSVSLAGEGEARTILNIIRSNAKSYNFRSDPEGELFWRDVFSRRVSGEVEGSFENGVLPTGDEIIIVDRLIAFYKFLIEDRRLSEELYDGSGKRRPEKSAQRLFFATVVGMCRMLDLDVTPEADTGNGPVDFKFSRGAFRRVVVEVKMSDSNGLLAGAQKQLQTYAKAESVVKGYYLVVQVDFIASRTLEQLQKICDDASSVSRSFELIIVDARRRPSASKLKFSA